VYTKINKGEDKVSDCEIKVLIHFTLPDGSSDSVVIAGNSLKDVQALAAFEVKSRNATDPWSETLN